MAAELEAVWQVKQQQDLALRDLEGLVVTRYEHIAPCEHIEVIEAAHPVPDAMGLEVSQRMLQLVSGLSADDTVICLLSGAVPLC